MSQKESMKQRQSNIELLRIICMFFVVVNHFFIHAFPKSQSFASESIFWTQVPNALSAFCQMAVVIFVLISGYFGIHPNWKRFFGMYFQYAFYAGLCYSIYLLVTGTNINRWLIYNTLLPFTHNPGGWFIVTYLFLFMLAPLLNKAIESISKQQFKYALLGFTIINVYFGFFYQNEVNPHGHNLANFIYLYFIGRYLRLYFHPNIQKLKRWSAFSWLLGCCIYAFLWIGNDVQWHSWNPLFTTMRYDNHPLLIFNSISFFLWFTTLSFQSKVINWLSSGVLSVYLVHDCTYLRGLWYQFVANVYDLFPPPILRYAMLLVIAISFILCCLLFDKIRVKLTSPFEEYCCKLVQIIQLKILNNK